MKTETDAKNTVKAAIQNASGHAQSTIHKTETAAVAAVDRVEDAMKAAQTNFKTGFESLKSFGGDVVGVIDNAGRTVLGSAVTVNGSLVNYGKDAIADTIDVGRKSFEVKSVHEFVALHTSFTERRLNAVFHTVAQLNTIAQNNAFAIWGPFAKLANTVGANAAATVEPAAKPNLKSAA